MLLGHARGKVGDLVFSRSNGEQVTRARASVVKNPRTDIQLIQRILLNTVSQAYSKMQPIVDHSWEGVQVGQASMSRFMRTNLKAIRSRVAAEIAAFTDLDSIVAFTPLGSNKFAPNTYAISAGSLPTVAVEQASPVSTLSMVAPVFAEATSYQDIIDAAGLKRGDQLTFCSVKGSSLVDPIFSFCRVILDPTSDTGQPLPLTTAFLEAGAINKPSPRNTGAFTTVALSASGLTFNVGGNLPTLASAIIVSRQANDGKWMRSNASLVLNGAAVVGEFPSLQQCLDLAASGDISDISDLYLNNAGETTPINTQGVAISSAYYTQGGDELIWPGEGETGEIASPFGCDFYGNGLTNSIMKLHVKIVTGPESESDLDMPLIFSGDGKRAYLPADTVLPALTGNASMYVLIGDVQWGGTLTWVNS